MVISLFRTPIVLQKSGAGDVDVNAGLPTLATSATALPTASGQQQCDDGGGHHDTDTTTSAAVVSFCRHSSRIKQPRRRLDRRRSKGVDRRFYLPALGGFAGYSHGLRPRAAIGCRAAPPRTAGLVSHITSMGT